MKFLMWVGIVLLAIFTIYIVVSMSIFYYMSRPATHNAKPLNAKISNQYYIKDGKVVYVIEGNFFAIGEVEIEGADLATFEVIDNAYAKDVNHVYYNGEKVLKGQPNSVSLIPSALNPSGLDTRYLISGNKVFSYGTEIKGADPTSFSLIAGAYAMDEHYIYYTYDVKIPREVTPKIMDNDQYLKHGEQVLYQGKVISEQASHFEVIDEQYSKDLNYVYSYADIIKDMEPEDFKVLSPYFRKDKNQVYYFNKTIKKSDPASFKILNNIISKDHQHLYYEQYLIQNKKPSEITQSDARDFANFSKWTSLHLDRDSVILVPSDDVKNISFAFFTYNNDVYSRFEKLDNAKPDDILVYEESDDLFIRINDKVFYNGILIPNAEPDTFTPISNNFSKDINNVYWFEHKVIDAQPATFNYKKGLYATQNESGEYVLVESEGLALE